MHSHLKSKHPAEGHASSGSETTTKQLPMTSFFGSPRKPANASAEVITQAIADMIISDYVPLSIVEAEGFRKLLGIVSPDYKIPCRNTVRTRIVKRYDEEKETLLSNLKDIEGAAITTDSWTSNSTESYMTVTEHHITEDWSMQANVLMTRAMPERHTGENIAKKLKDCVEEFGLTGKIETCVHDNARNMECAGDKCEDWTDLGCFAHTLQLCIKPVLELPSVSKTVARCRKLVGHFKHSTTVTAEMRKRQKLLGEPEHELVQDVVTRWNSTQMMLGRLSEQRRVLTDIMLDGKVTKKSDTSMLLKDSEWKAISELSEVLEDLTKVTTYMCAELDVSSSQIFPIVCGLIRTLSMDTDTDSALIVRVKDTIVTQLKKRFQPTSTDAAKSVPVMASLLDPRFKRLPFLTKEQRETAHSELEERIADINLIYTPREDTEPTPSKRQRLDFMMFEFDSPDNEKTDELQSYLMEKGACDAKPLAWWKDNAGKYPKIAKVARKVLAVPATSVPSERVFSATGLLINKLRNRLASDLVDNIIFLNKNRVQLLSD